MFSGGAFHCISSSDSITLLHSRFNRTSGASGSCNNGSVLGNGLYTVNNTYTSQLTVIILNSSMDGTTIECQYDNGMTSKRVGFITLSAKDCSGKEYESFHIVI